MARPKVKQPTKRMLEAMGSALSAMLAGEDNQGDWPETVSRDDLENAADWVGRMKAKAK